jgi:cytohesin
MGCMAFLLQCGADVNALDYRHSSALHLAARYGFTSGVNRLIQHGADVKVKDSRGRTPMHGACVLSNAITATNILGALIERSADLYARDCQGATPLHKAAFVGNDQVLAYLMDSRHSAPGVASSDEAKRVDPALIRDDAGLLLLHCAAASGSTQCLKYWLDEHGGAQPIDSADQRGYTALHYSAFGGHVDGVRLLLAAGASATACSDDRELATPLHKACHNGSIECAEMLIAAGARLDARDAEGALPLHKAVKRGHTQLLRFLQRQSGAPPASETAMLADYFESTTLHKAAFGKHSGLINIMLLAAATGDVDLDGRDVDGRTPLHQAAYSGDVPCVKILVDRGADINGADDRGTRPLHVAARLGHWEVLDTLCDAGVDLAKKYKRKTAAAASTGAAATSATAAAATSSSTTAARAPTPNSSGSGRSGKSTSHQRSKSVGHSKNAALAPGAGRAKQHGASPSPANDDDEEEADVAGGASVGGGASSTTLTEDDSRSVAGDETAAAAPTQHVVESALLVDAPDGDGKTALQLALERRCNDSVRVLLQFGAEVRGDYVPLFADDAIDLVRMSEELPSDVMRALHRLDGLADKLTGALILDDGDDLGPLPDLERFEVADDKRAALSEAIELFNRRPTKGVAMLFERGVMPRHPREVARLLFIESDRLNLAEVGEYLGSGGKFETAVRRYFASFVSFAGLDFDLALRRFLRKFRLPGESQKIDRLVQTFAERYYIANKGEARIQVLTSAQAAYKLAFAIIMLNTDAHNDNVKKEKKMTLPQFLENCAGLNDGADVPIDVLTDLYWRIVQNEIVMNPESEFANAERAGYLHIRLKRVGRGHRWKRRWFILSDNNLYFVRAPGSKDIVGRINLADRCVAKIASDAKASKSKAKLVPFNLISNEANVPPITLRAESSRDCQGWVDSIQNAGGPTPLPQDEPKQ